MAHAYGKKRKESGTFNASFHCVSPARPNQPVPSEVPDYGTGTPKDGVPRPGDLPYFIVVIVLGTFIFIIVAFIPFCLWRTWAKQSEFPSVVLKPPQITPHPIPFDLTSFRANIRHVFSRRGLPRAFVPVHHGPSPGACPGWPLPAGWSHARSPWSLPR